MKTPPRQLQQPRIWEKKKRGTGGKDSWDTLRPIGDDDHYEIKATPSAMRKRAQA